MADAVLMAGGTGGVSSDDVTAGKAQVLQGYKTVMMKLSKARWSTVEMEWMRWILQMHIWKANL